MNGLYVQATIAFFFFKNIVMILANAYKLSSIYYEYKETIELEMRPRARRKSCQKNVKFDFSNDVLTNEESNTVKVPNVSEKVNDVKTDNPS